MQKNCAFYLGMDGGGTKTECVLLAKFPNGSLQEKKRFCVSGINYNSYSKDQITAAVIEIGETVYEVLSGEQELAGIGIGAAGISNPQAIPFLRECVRKAGFFCTCEICGDDRAALIGAVGTGKGILLISGTGSVCLASDGAGHFYRAGGWGHLIDDAGSAYAIGRDILSAVVREADGRGERTLLTKEVMEYLQISNIQQLIAYVYAPETGKKGIAKLSALLNDALEKRDEAAIWIAQNAIKGQIELIRAVSIQITTESERERQKIPLILGGGVLCNNRYIRGLLEEIIAKENPDIFVTEPEQDAAYGAAMLAIQKGENERFIDKNLSLGRTVEEPGIS